MHPQKPFGSTHEPQTPSRVLKPWEIRTDTFGTRVGLQQPTESGAILSVFTKSAHVGALMSRDSLRSLRDALNVVLGE